MTGLKLILLAVVASLYATEAVIKDKLLGGSEYLPCDYCDIHKDDYPEEGTMACYGVRRSNKTVSGRVERCKQVEVCDPPFFFPCRFETKCTYHKRNVTVLSCRLAERFTTKQIKQRNETYGTIYQINSPNYFGYSAYPSNLYCIWNIANKGFVTYRIIDQKLQPPSKCDGPGCDCPDHMKIKMGANEVKLCSNETPAIVNQMSSDGLQVKFCSDNAHTAKGILLMAYRHTRQQNMSEVLLPTTINATDIVINATNITKKRHVKRSQHTCADAEKKIDDMATSIGQMGCQYEMMMRMTQPGVPCPDDQTIMAMVKSHDYLMFDFEQTMPMCNGMDGLTTRMPMMNSIESCAVDYLYRTRDCEFAKRLVNTTNGELSDVARMIAENNFPIKIAKWANTTRTNCKRD